MMYIKHSLKIYGHYIKVSINTGASLCPEPEYPDGRDAHLATDTSGAVCTRHSLVIEADARGPLIGP